MSTGTSTPRPGSPDEHAGGEQKVPVNIVGAIPLSVLFVCVASFWGLNTVAMRVAGRHVPPLSVAAARSLVGGLILLAIAKRRKADRPRSRDEWMGVISLGLVMTGASTACLFLAAKNIPAGLVSILTNTMPIFVAILAPVMLSERITRQTAIGLLIGLGGTVIVAWRSIDGDVRPLGIVYGLGGSAATALGGLLYKRFPMPRLDRTMVVSSQLLASCVLLTLLAIPDDRSNMRFPWTFTLSFAYLSLFGLALSFMFFSELMRRGSGLQSSAVSYLATVLGVVFGAIFLSERLSWTTLLGGAITIGGVMIVQSPVLMAGRRSATQ